MFLRFAPDAGATGGTSATDKTADNPADAGTAGKDKPVEKGSDKGAEKGKVDEPARLSMTQEELDQRIASALESQRKKDEAAAKKKKDEDDRKAAEAQGNWEKAAKSADEKREEAERERDAAKLRARQAEVKGMLRDYVAAKHPDYAVAADKDADPPTAFMWESLAPQIEAETDDAAANKLIEQAVNRYVKANPRQAKGTAGAPAAPRSTRAGATNPDARTTRGAEPSVPDGRAAGRRLVRRMF